MEARIEKLFEMASHPNTPDAEALNAVRAIRRELGGKSWEHVVVVDNVASDPLRYVLKAQDEKIAELNEQLAAKANGAPLARKLRAEISGLKARISELEASRVQTEVSVQAATKAQLDRIAKLEAEVETGRQRITELEDEVASGRDAFAVYKVRVNLAGAERQAWSLLLPKGWLRAADMVEAGMSHGSVSNAMKRLGALGVIEVNGRGEGESTIYRRHPDADRITVAALEATD